MIFLQGLLGAILGLIIVIFIVFAIIYIGIRKSVGSAGIRTLKDVMKNNSSYEKTEYTRIKDVSGMTTMLEPVILRDFPDFNKNLLYNQVEKNLLKVFECLSEKSVDNIKNDNDMVLLFAKLKERVDFSKRVDATVKYEDIKFHRHSIKEYQRNNGTATITIVSSLEYYYIIEGNEREKLIEGKSFSNLKKQTRYISKFIYIYDETKVREKANLISAHCPNCGAPTTKSGVCEYCGSRLEPINLKLWKMTEYKEV